MKLSSLIVNSLINEATRCGIHNSLLKFRPDLKDEMDKIEGRDVKQSTQFLKLNGLWDEHADALLDNAQRWQHEHHLGPDEESERKMIEHMHTLMCHVAKLIRQSAVSIDR